MQHGELLLALKLSSVSQIGVWVHDLDRTLEQYTKTFGLGPFQVVDFEPEQHWYRGRPAPLRMRLAKAHRGAVELELIEPVAGRSIHRDRLAEIGEGLGHLGFKVPDYEAAFEAFVQAGFPCLERVETSIPPYPGLVKAAYFDTRRIGGVFFQIMWRSWEK